ncbi:MAG: hypothetical protein KKC79_00380 [Gammaproteobacteria bacterium]|nr:hypothetical protein [Gammaproteobacteria bacterium]
MELALDGEQDAAGTLVVVAVPQLVVVLPLDELAFAGVHEPTGVGLPVTVLQLVVTKLASVPAAQDATSVDGVLLLLQVTVRKPLDDEAVWGEQLAAGLGPLWLVEQLVEV